MVEARVDVARVAITKHTIHTKHVQHRAKLHQPTRHGAHTTRCQAVHGVAWRGVDCRRNTYYDELITCMSVYMMLLLPMCVRLMCCCVMCVQPHVMCDVQCMRML